MQDLQNKVWEETIEQLLGDDNPCKICLVKVTCSKSFVSKTACENLAIKLAKAMEKIKNENKTRLCDK